MCSTIIFCFESTVESDVLDITCWSDNQVQPFEYPVCMAIDVVYTLKEGCFLFVWGKKRPKVERCSRGQHCIWFCTLWDSWRIQNIPVLINVIFVIKIWQKDGNQLKDILRFYICRTYFVHLLWRMFTCPWVCEFQLYTMYHCRKLY